MKRKLIDRDGRDVDGFYPMPGELVTYQCFKCKKVCDGKMPHPGRKLILCKACVYSMEKDLKIK